MMTGKHKILWTILAVIAGLSIILFSFLPLLTAL